MEITEAIVPTTDTPAAEPSSNGHTEPTAPEVLAAVTTIVKEARRRDATIDSLMHKRVREIDVPINSQEDDGTDVELVLRYRAISSLEFDALQAKYPPNARQKQDGYAYNPDTFGPALVAAVCISPKMTVEDVTTLISSGAWSAGEVNTLTGSAYALCNAGAGVPFTVSG